MIQGKVEGTEELYDKIPFFLRTRLHDFIDNVQWAHISQECQKNNPTEINNAQLYYVKILALMEQFIENERNSPSQSDSGVMMTFARYSVMNTFQDDGVLFATEMSTCLQKEKELLYLHSANYEQEANNIPFAPDNYMLPEISDTFSVIKGLQRDVEQAKICIQSISEEFGEESSDLPSMLPDQLLNAKNVLEGAAIDATWDEQMEVVAAKASLQWTEATINSHIESMIANDAESHEMRQRVMRILQRTVEQLDQLLSGLEKEVSEWREAEARASVKTGPDISPVVVNQNFKEFAHLLEALDRVFHKMHESPGMSAGSSSFPGQLAALHRSFKLAENRFFSSALVVSIQLKDVIDIANKGSKDSDADKESKKEMNFCSNKNQNLHTEVRILGGESFSGLNITDSNIELVAERDLVRMESDVKQEGGKKFLKLPPGKVLASGLMVSIEWKDIEVQNFSRVEQNTVYKQFFRMRYSVTVEVHGTEYRLETLSLPFMFKTGSNQLLEFIGARMWYCSNADLYKGSFECPNSLPVEDVINMLNNRITFATSKKRQLTSEDKAFLRNRLTVNEEGQVSMQGFIKPNQEGAKSSKKSGAETNPSFYSWFHGVVGSIERYLLKPWEDGIIYGFCSPADVERKLMSDHVPEGTILFRPSANKLESAASKKATTALIMAVKTRNESSYAVMSVPLYGDFIEKNGFYKSVRNIKDEKNQRIAKFLYGCGERNRSIVEALEKYGKEERESKYYYDYKLMVKKVETLSVRFCNSKVEASSDGTSDTDEQGRPGAKKRRYPSINSSKPFSPSSTSSQSGTFPTASPDSSGPTFSGTFQSMSHEGSSTGSPVLKSEPSTPVSACPENTPRAECGVVDGSDATSLASPDPERVPVSSKSLPVSQNLQVFGNVQVDLSNIPPAYTEEVQVVTTQQFPVQTRGKTLSTAQGMEGRTQIPQNLNQTQFSPPPMSVPPSVYPAGINAFDLNTVGMSIGNFSVQFIDQNGVMISEMTTMPDQGEMATTVFMSQGNTAVQRGASGSVLGNVPTVLAEAKEQTPHRRRSRKQLPTCQATSRNLTQVPYLNIQSQNATDNSANNLYSTSSPLQIGDPNMMTTLDANTILQLLSAQNNSNTGNLEIISELNDPATVNELLNEQLATELQMSDIVEYLKETETEEDSRSPDSGIF